MTRDEQQSLRKQLLLLYDYSDLIHKALDTIKANESQSVLSLRINKLEVPPLDDLRVFDEEGRTIDWTDFPKELKRRPFMIFPGAKLETYRKFDLEMDFELNSAFLVNLLTYLYKQVNQAIDTSQNKLHGHKD
jgi:hypothetical protein